MSDLLRSRAARRMAVGEDVARTLVLEAGPSVEPLIAKLQAALSSPGPRFRTWVLCHESRQESMRPELSRHFPTVEILYFEGDSAIERMAARVESGAVAFLPAESAFVIPPWDDLLETPSLVLPCVPRFPLPSYGTLEHPVSVSGWMTQSSVLRAIRGLRLSSPTLPRLAAAACNLGRPLEIGSARADAGSPAPPERASDRTVLSAGASVLVVIPQYRCEEWLEQCLSSMVTQTRKAHGIVVVDDGSTSPPTTIVERFPSVTLLRSRENVGPYRLIESVIRRTRYDAYLFQDADDWSTSDRLELLIAEAEKTGAELVGCQELKVTSSDDGETFATTYPLDVNRALALEPTHALVHPASLVARALVERIGGFASELRFGGDTEFLFRAAHVARIVNVDRFCYFTRVRPGSLTTSEDTRAKSPARRQLGREIVDRARQNYGRAGRGEAPDLRPLRVADAVPLEHVTGPALVPSG